MPTELFISYKREPASTALVLRLKAFVEAAHPHVEVVYDEKGVQTGGDIRDYMAKLTGGDYIIFLIGPDFLESHWCMYELGLAAEKENFKDRMFPVLLPGTALDHDRILEEVDRWTTKWEKQRDAIAALKKRNPKTVTPALRDREQVLEQIAIGCSTALDLVLRIKWLEVDAQGRLDMDKLQGFLQGWIKPPVASSQAATAQTASAQLTAVSYPPPIQQLLDDMVFVQGGSFMMGSEDEEAQGDEKPVHEVRLKDYHIGKYPVTQAQWEAVMGENPSHFRGCADCPVENVSWNDCQTFIKKLNTLTGLHFNLPTEAQWEYAARGGQAGKGQNYKYAGGNDLDQVGWYDGNSDKKTHPVGGLAANALGLHDMSGNVWEWCRDYYDGKYYAQFKGNVAVDPLGPSTGTYMVLRGGSWIDFPRDCRVAYRFNDRADYLNYLVGMRLQRD